MRREHIQRVVDFDPVLDDVDGLLRDDTGNGADNQGLYRADKARGGGMEASPAMAAVSRGE